MKNVRFCVLGTFLVLVWLAGIVQALPVADFTANVTTGAAPLAVKFTDTSTGTGISAWNWDFDNDAIIDSTAQNPVYTYASAGTYTVNLSVTGTEGTDSKVRTNYITVTPAPTAPVADFTANVTTGTAPLAVKFTDTSTGTDISAWSWDFNNDGSVDSTLRSPGYVFSTAGDYTVSLTVTGTGGSDSELKMDYIRAHSIPLASFTITSPDGGETWQRGTTHTVTWDYTGSPGEYVKIVLLKGSTEVGTIVDSVPVGSGGKGSYTWPINPTGATGSDFKVSVQSTSQPTIKDVSNNYFILTTAPATSSITVTAPDGGETWQRGTSQTVTWDYTGSPGSTVKIVLVKAGTEVGTIIASTSTGSGGKGSYTWPINPTGTTGSDLKVSVQSISQPTINDTSDNYFSLSSSPPVLKEYPKIMIQTDDGYYTNLQYAYPILSAYDFTATAYVITGAANWPGYLSVDNMRTLNNAGWDIANHGRNHVYMTGLTTAEVEANIRGGQQDLNGWGFTRAMYHFAYPYGDYNTQVISSAQNVGTLTARTVNTGHIIMPQSNLLELKATLEVERWTTVSEVESIIEGGSENEIIILLFHRITPIAGDYNWSDTNFRELATWMHDNGYQTITVSQFYALNGGTITPVAGFTANRTAGAPPLAVQFTDTSTGTGISAWTWDFNNDMIIDSTSKNPVYTYSSPGTYTVNHGISWNGGTDSEVRTNYITVTTAPIAPVADFITNHTAGTPPLAVQFTDTSTGTGISAWTWDFNNDMIIDSTSKNPVYTYSSAGIYTVNHTVSGTGGSDSEVRTNYITVTAPIAPVADFTANRTTGTQPLAVQFTDTSTGTVISSWIWDFNNDMIIDSTSKNPTYTYASPGTYTVNHTVSGTGGTDSEVRTNYITVTVSAVPVADFTANRTTGTQPLAVQFTDTSTGTGISAWTWDFNNDMIVDSTSQNPTYIYASPGTNTVNHTVSGTGGTDSEVRTNYITVTPAPGAPVANFTVNRTTGTHPLAVQFTDTSTGTGISAWTWDFNNDMIIDSTSQNPTYIYASPGIYTVNHTVSGTGGTDSEVRADCILINAPVSSNIGLYQNGIWYLDTNGNGAWDAGSDKVFNFGAPGWSPVLGDWNGDSRTGIGLYQNGIWYLDTNGNGAWDAGSDKVFNFGAPGWSPVLGKGW